MQPKRGPASGRNLARRSSFNRLFARRLENLSRGSASSTPTCAWSSCNQRYQQLFEYPAAWVAWPARSRPDPYNAKRGWWDRRCPMRRRAAPAHRRAGKAHQSPHLAGSFRTEVLEISRQSDAGRRIRDQLISYVTAYKLAQPRAQRLMRRSMIGLCTHRRATARNASWPRPRFLPIRPTILRRAFSLRASQRPGSADDLSAPCFHLVGAAGLTPEASLQTAALHLRAWWARPKRRWSLAENCWGGLLYISRLDSGAQEARLDTLPWLKCQPLRPNSP